MASIPKVKELEQCLNLYQIMYQDAGVLHVLQEQCMLYSYSQWSVVQRWVDFSRKEGGLALTQSNLDLFERQDLRPQWHQSHKDRGTDWIQSYNSEDIKWGLALNLFCSQLPILTVEKNGFKNLCMKINPKLKYPSLAEIMNFLCFNVYTICKQAALARMSGCSFFSCSTDLHCNTTGDPCRVITVQYISDSWEVEDLTFGCGGMLPNLGPVELGEAFAEVLSEWRLNVSKMSAITTGNLSHMRQGFSSRSWIPCFLHSVDLCVDKLLLLDLVSAPLSRLRKVVSAFTRSTQYREALLKKQTELSLSKDQLILDQPKRWRSTYSMVNRFLEQEEVVSAVLTENGKSHLLLQEAEITVLKDVHSVLHPLFELMEALLVEKPIIMSSIPPVLWRMNSSMSVADGDSDLVKQMKQMMMSDLKKQYGSECLQTVLDCASFLDPRFKNTFVTDPQAVRTELMGQVMTLPQPPTVGTQQSMEPAPSFSSFNPSTPEPQGKRRRSDLQGLLCDIKNQKELETPTGKSLPQEDLQCEIAFYQKTQEIQPDQSPLAWWKKNCILFPILASFAKKYLCVSALSCPSELVYSSSELSTTAGGSRVTPEQLNKLVFLSRTLQKKQL
ncbi:ZBED1 protein, partial [Amia calva]|nr:ZBED1 protein [Amia calva]